ncbi:hypothetical protein ASE19_09115 [Nocardioides sp. Root79]|nr:hypothetical protein ASE19_09115 [Nocardioides sp. Root79]KRC72745.1 hypothetical protein ASE20_05650 [Nocardioides sp. Root240]
MCRGCCCGTRRKHPDVDHDAIALALGEELGEDAELLAVDCLWACDLSNVVVVNPSPAARTGGARPAWVTEVNTVDRARVVAHWVRAGGPGVAPVPADLGEVHTAAGLRRISNAAW